MAGITPGKILALGADTAFLSTRALPDAPDGYYDWEVSTDPTDLKQGHSIVTNLGTKVSIFSVRKTTSSDAQHLRLPTSQTRAASNQISVSQSVQFLL